MKVLIVEDEGLAAERLAQLIGQYDPTIQILDSLDSVEETLDWLSRHPEPDVLFLDIQLADGLSFDIFQKRRLTCPVIFTTAYDRYALQAFKVNSIDYLLKPIDLDDLQKAFAKYEELKNRFQGETPYLPMENIKAAMQMFTKQYKTRFLVKSGHHLSSIQVPEIAYFYHEHKMVWLKKQDGKKHVVDYTLEQLENMLDPQQFFRLNRKYLASIQSIMDVVSYSGSRLKVILQGMPEGETVLISRERVGAFKAWMDG